MLKNHKSILPLLFVMGLLAALPANAQTPGKVFKAMSAFEKITTAIEKGARRSQLIDHCSQLSQKVFETNKFQSSVFWGRQPGHIGSDFAGFVFKTTYEGKEEIFGAIAAQSAISKETVWREKEEIKNFTARIKVSGHEVDIPATVVQTSSPTMFDMALVKFAPEAERFLFPLKLSDQMPALDAPLRSIGFDGGKLTFANHKHRGFSALSLRVSLENGPSNWPGMWGGPVLNPEGEVVGIRTTKYYLAPQIFPRSASQEMKDEDIGFVTHAQFLNTLVRAYHNNGKATFPLILGNEKILDLNVDASVSSVALVNEKGNTIWSDNHIAYRFPREAIADFLPQARYIELSIQPESWIPRLYNVTYDTKTREIIRQGWE